MRSECPLSVIWSSLGCVFLCLEYSLSSGNSFFISSSPCLGCIEFPHGGSFSWEFCGCFVCKDSMGCSHLVLLCQ